MSTICGASSGKERQCFAIFFFEKPVFRVHPYTQICCRNIVEKKLFYEELRSSSNSEEEIGPSTRTIKVDSIDEESDDTLSNDQDDLITSPSIYLFCIYI